MSNNNYFIKQVGLLPDFSPYYNCFGTAASNNLLQFMSTAMPDLNGDGRDDIVLFLNQQQSSYGVVTNEPTPNREIILISQADGTYKDLTFELLGGGASAATGFSLNGYSNETVIADVNSDGRPDIIIAESREDGRSIIGDNKVNAYAISQVQISQSDGTYRTVNIGEATFCGKGSIQVLNTNGGTEIFMAGYHAQSTSLWTGANSVGAYTQPVFQLNSAGTGFDIVRQVATDAYGAAVLSSSQVVLKTVYFSGGVPAGSAYAVEEIDAAGNISYGPPLIPYQSKTISNYVAWNGDRGNTDVFTVNGELVGAGLPATLGAMVVAPGAPPVVVTQLEGAVLGTPRSDGCYYQMDSQSYSKIDFWNVVGNQLVAAKVKLVGENTRAYTQDFQFIDIDHDGLNDFVVDVRADGKNGGHGIAPDVYLNDGAGDLIHVNQSFLPTSEISGNYIGKFADFNGDGKYDLLYTPWYPSVYEGSNTQPDIYYGNGDFETAITDNVTIGDRNSGKLMRTWAGDDTIYDTGANAVASINGGLGTDKCVYSSAASVYSITRNADSTTTVKNASLTDTLTNIERVQFADITMNLTAKSEAAKIASSDLQRLEELYVAFFNRVPDADGLVYWVNQFKSGATLNAIADSFYDAGVAYASITGYSATMSDSDFVKKIYANVLGRTDTFNPPPAADVEYWANKLASNTATRGSLVDSMLTAAHGFKGDSTWGWVPDLLDNKIVVANKFAVDYGINYNTADDSIKHGVEIAAAVTSTDTSAAIALIGVHS